MNAPSNAAKAASILHHTWGVSSAKEAVILYDRLDAMNDEEFNAELEAAAGWGIYQAYELMNAMDIWGDIYSLAVSIDNCREELQ